MTGTRRGRPRGSVTGPPSQERVEAALRLLQRSTLQPREILAGIGITEPEVYWQILQLDGHVPCDQTMQEFMAAVEDARSRLEIMQNQVSPPESPAVQVVRMAPLQDGVDPMEGLFYLADAMKDLATAMKENTDRRRMK